MKKLFITAILAISALSASAMGIRSLDMKANLREDFGLGLGMTFNLPAKFEFAPSLNYYFNSANTLTIDADFRYRFDLPRDFSLYPVLGPVYFHCDGYNKIGLNIGLGFNYNINDNWAVGAEAKYQYVNHWDDLYLTIGASYLF